MDACTLCTSVTPVCRTCVEAAARRAHELFCIARSARACVRKPRCVRAQSRRRCYVADRATAPGQSSERTPPPRPPPQRNTHRKRTRTHARTRAHPRKHANIQCTHALHEAHTHRESQPVDTHTTTPVRKNAHAHTHARTRSVSHCRASSCAGVSGSTNTCCGCGCTATGDSAISGGITGKCIPNCCTCRGGYGGGDGSDVG
jgi:hypothetical protein